MRSTLAVLTLALGIGAGTAIFSFVNPLLIHPFTYPRADELVTVEERDPQGNAAPVSLPAFRDWSTQSAAFSGMAAFDIGFFFLTGVEEPEQVPGALVTPNLFRVLGVAPALGRDFRDDDEHTVILTDACWKRRFGGDPGILGRAIALDFARTPQVERYTVIGVMPPKFWMYYGNFEVFVTLERRVIPKVRTARMLYAIGRRRTGVSVEQAQSALSAIPAEKDWGVLVRSWEQRASQPVRAQLWVLAAAAGLLLLIASANVAGLWLVRAQTRRREIAIRTALGATPWRLVWLFLSESLRIGFAAAILGIVLAWWGVRTMMALLPPDVEMTRFLPGLARVSVDPAALLFAIAAALVACTLAGAFPARQARDIEVTSGLKDAGTIESQRARKVLVTAQVAMSVILLSGAGLLIKTLERIRAIDLGFRPEKLLVLRVPMLPGHANSPDYRTAYRELAARVAALPGVRSAALTSSLTGRLRTGFEIPGGEKFSAGDQVVQPDYFATLRIPLRRGRYFDDRDERRVIINETMARRYWPDRDPVGQSIRLDGEALEVIGVAADTRPRVFRDPDPLVYRPLRDGSAGQLAVRTAGDPLTVARSVSAVVRELGGVVAEVGTMQHFVQNDTWRQEQTANLLAVFGALALALSTVGLYGVIAFAVARRTREIGIRVAVGARPANVIGLVLRDCGAAVMAGVALGLAAALSLNRMLASLLYQVSPADPQVLAGAASVVVIAALIACWLPVRRALRVDPLVALRYE